MNKDIIDRIKEANNIVDVISERLQTHKSGVNYIAVCPFHSDKTPSLTISPSKQIYKCFACGAGGDVIKFVQEYDGISFYDAVKYLANRAHIDLPQDVEESDDDRKNRLEREALLSQARKDQEVYSAGRVKKEFYEYLAKRNISQQTAENFGLGYAADGFFRYRITYPFYDLSGNIIGFTGRAVQWDKQSKYPKYKNSAESSIYHKERVIFGLHQSKRAIMDANNVYWVEGQNDVLSLHQHDVKNAVCGSGTAFTENYAKIISRFTRKVTLIYDADKAGRNAALKAIHILLKANLDVAIITLPEGEDPDSFSQSVDSVSVSLQNMTKNWSSYILGTWPYAPNDPSANTANIELAMSYADDISNDITRKQYLHILADYYHVGIDDIRKLLKPVQNLSVWENGYYGFDEAREVVGMNNMYILTFDEKYFIENVSVLPVILWKGEPTKHLIQMFRTKINTICLREQELKGFGFEQSHEVKVVSQFVTENIRVFVSTTDGEETLYTDYMVDAVHEELPKYNTSQKSIIIERSLEVIAHTNDTMRTMRANDWAQKFNLKVADYNKLLKPIISKIAQTDNFDKTKSNYDAAQEINLFELPDYVEKDKDMLKVYNKEGYYPLIRKDGKRCAYVFKNERTDGHSIVSDFYMVPLLHVYSTDKQNNKRVLQLIHSNPAIPDKYVEWMSSVLTTPNSIEDQLINEGKYNFKGTPFQYKALRSELLYGFTTCEALGNYGQHKRGFWAFSNAIYHTVTDPLTGQTENRIDYTNNLGVVAHGDRNYYSPACSEIFLEEDNPQYEQDRFLIYKEIPKKDQITFAEWASLMNEVYKINDNGKWAIILDIMACFRDFIYDTRRSFTTLFFIGPTGSGKSQIAYSCRSLFMSPDAPVFNLNSGSDAAFWLVLARYRNVISVMEEYNDQTISSIKFQGLKSAVFDGEGRMKVGNVAAKQIDTSQINSIPLILGQEAPQQDDGSLANRCVICDVPIKANGVFSKEEIALFENLKRHEKIGLCNVLIEILDIRDTFTKNFNMYFGEEIEELKKRLINNTNSEGLTRILNSVAMFTATCRIIEEKTRLKLPFTYEEFFELAVSKTIDQVDTISTSNKLSTYFDDISSLLTEGKIVYGREFKIEVPEGGILTVQRQGKSEIINVPEGTEVLYLNTKGIYPLYKAMAGGEALSKTSLKNYMLANAAYIGYCKSTRYEYIIDTVVETKDDDFGNQEIKRTYESKSINTTAQMFDYRKIVEMMSVDLKRDRGGNEGGDLSQRTVEVPF